jgi:hypothetical protein
LRRNEVRDLFRPCQIADVVATQARDEVRRGDEVLSRPSGSLEMRRIMRTKASPFETEVVVGGLGRRDGTRKLRHRDRMLFVPNVDHPYWQENLVAVRVESFPIRGNKPAIKKSEIDRVESNPSP